MQTSQQTSQQITETRNQLLNDAQQLANGKHVDAETRSKITDLIAKADSLTEDLNIAKRLEQHSDELRAATRPPRGEMSTTDQTQNAFRTWMQTGQIDRSILRESRESRDLGSFTGGGQGTNTIASSVLVPVGFDPLLSVAQKSYGQLVGAVRSLVTSTGEPLKYAMADDTENDLALLATEITAPTETDPSMTGGISYVDDLTTGIVKVSNNLLNDAAFSISDFISQTFGQRYFKGLSRMVQQGNGSHIASIAANVPVTVTTAAPTAIGIDDITNLMASLDPAYLERSSWLFSPAVKAYLVTLKDGYGRSYLQPDPTNGTLFSTLYGRPIVSSTYAPTVAAANVPIVFGDLTSYTLRTVTDGLQIVRLNERYADTNEVGFLGRTRAGGWSVLQTVSPALVSLKMHA